MNNGRGAMKELTKDYAARDIYNADETGLYFRMEPNSTYAPVGVEIHGKNKHKEKIT